MDGYFEAPLHGWTTTETSHNETLDLLYYRCQTARQAQEVFLEQSTPYLETARETLEVAEGQPHHTQESIWRWSEAQMAATWSSFWGEEGFFYCLSPDKVCSLESISSSESLAASSFGGEEIRGDVLSEAEGTQIDEEYSILSLKASSSSSSSSLRSCPFTETSNLAIMSPMSNSRVIDPEDPDEGEALDLPDSERPGLRPSDFGFLPPDHIPPRSPVPVTRAEPITVTLGNWEHQVTVIKPNADYRDVPSPIMLPGSPPQHSCKPSLGGFYKAPPRRDSAGAFTVTGEIPGLGISNNEQLFLPPSPLLKIPEHAVNFMNHPSNSDVSVLNLGSPTQPVVAPVHVISPSLPSDHERQKSQHHHPFLDCASTYSPPLSKPQGRVASVSGSSTVQSTGDSEMPSSKLLQRRQLLHVDEAIRPPTILSVEVPEGNDLSWSAPVSPQKLSGLSSPGVMFKLDEELNLNDS